MRPSSATMRTPAWNSSRMRSVSVAVMFGDATGRPMSACYPLRRRRLRAAHTHGLKDQRSLRPLTTVAHTSDFQQRSSPFVESRAERR